MKKVIILAAAAAIIVCSCGTTRYAGSTGSAGSGPAASTLGKEIAKSPAQIKAEDLNATTLRAWASYNGLSTARPAASAAAAARGELVNSIAALVENANTLYAEQYAQESMSSNGVQKQMSANTSAKNKITQVAKELVRYAPVIETNEYLQADGTVTAYVCVELHPDRILEAVRKSDAYIEAVNKDQQAYIDFKSEKYSESMQGAFEELKKAKNNE